jgi:ubiquinone/menaquinone biosynthesis C-methylase UbiE
MRPYHVAETYDPMTRHLLPYDNIAAYLVTRLRAYRPELNRILDLACGTGNLTIPLAQAGYQVTGLDISPEMLAVAREKAAEAGLDISFVCQNMCQSYPGEPVDAITCFYGGLNFLNSSQALREGLAAAQAALKPGGLFAFEQFAAAKMRAIFNGTRTADVGDFYVVTNSRTDESGQVMHNVTFFLREADGRYQREEEQHCLRIHPAEEIKSLLAETGFILRSISELYPQVNARLLQEVYLYIAQKGEA